MARIAYFRVSNPADVAQWWRANGASLSQTEVQFDLALSAVQRYCSTKGRAPADYPAANFARMTDASLDSLLTKLECDVPDRADFGPFRGRRE